MALLAQRSTSSLVAKRSAPAVRLSNGGIRFRVASLDVLTSGNIKTDERGFVLKEVRVVLKQGGRVSEPLQAAGLRIMLG
jgi:hypothetical protein